MRKVSFSRLMDPAIKSRDDGGDCLVDPVIKSQGDGGIFDPLSQIKNPAKAGFLMVSSVGCRCPVVEGKSDQVVWPCPRSFALRS